MQHERKCASDAFFESMVGTSSWVDTLFVWFPAAWMPLVVEAIRWKIARWGDRGRHQGAVARTDVSHTRIPDNREFSYKLKRWQVDSLHGMAAKGRVSCCLAAWKLKSG